MRTPLQRELLFVLVLLVSFSFVSCDSAGDSSPNPNLVDGVALSGSDRSDVAAVATHEDGEWFTAYSREGPNQVSEVVYSDGDGNRATIKFDNRGRPSTAVTGPYVLTFGNFNGSRADVALVDTRSGEIETFDQVDLGTDFSSLRLSKAEDEELSPAEAAEVGGYGLTAFFCAAAVVPAPDSPFTGALCAGSVLAQVATAAAEQAGWGDTAEWVGFGISVGSCAGEGGTGPSCAEAVVEAGDIALDEDENQIEENEEEVAQASGVARFGGVWGYPDPDRQDDWFVVEEEKAFDAFRNEDDSCYDVTIGDYVGFDGNVFRYERREDGKIFRFEYTRVSEEELRIRRLSDDFTLTLQLDSEENADTYLNNRCGGSSTSSSSTLIAR